MPAGRLVDWPTALSIAGGDPELLRDISAAFLEECPQRLDEIDRAIHQADAAGLRRAAHTLKGAVAMFGVSSAFDHAQTLEEHAQAGRLDTAEGLLALLRRQVDEIAPEVAEFVHGRDVVSNR